MPILFNGVWIKQKDEQRFKGSEAKGINSTMIDNICGIDMDFSGFEITLKFELMTFDPMPLVAIETSNDFEFFF